MKLRKKSCGRCQGKKSHTYNNLSTSICQNWIHINGLFLFYISAAVKLQRVATADGVDHESQQVVYDEKMYVIETDCENIIICYLILFPNIFSQADEDSMVYSAPTFTCRKTSEAERRDAKTEEEESIYTAVKACGLK